MNEFDNGPLAGLNISDSGFAFDPRSGESFSVNRTGRQVIEGLLSGYDLERITRDLTDGFRVDASIIRRDLRDFLEQIRALRLAGAVQ